MKHQIDSKTGTVLLIMLLTISSCADSSPGNESTSKDVSETVSDDTYREIERLKWSIKTTKIRNRAIKEENKKLISRQKELESRIQELKKTLNQEETNSAKR